jgi:DNA-binding SARP family transcriptional activator
MSSPDQRILSSPDLPPYRLTTLGGASLTCRGRPVATQPRRLAVLVLLAAAGERGLTRDKLLGILWPEATPERARHALNQCMHSLRRDLEDGDEVFLGHGVLQLNPGLVRADLNELESAAAGARWDDVVPLYQGPFLDGFYLDDAPEFEEWVEGERRRLARLWLSALEQLALRAESERDWPRVVVWRERLAAADPLNARYTSALLGAYVEAGDRVRALRYGGEYEARVRRELGTPVDGEVARVLDQVRRPADARRPAPARATPASGATWSRSEMEARHHAWVARAVAPRFELRRVLMSGGTMTAFAATDLERSAEVVLNVVNPAASMTLDADRGATELARLGALSHPRLVPIVHAAWTGELLYYVEERPLAPPLSGWLRERGALPVDAAVVLWRQLAEPLAYAHAHGVVHGDLRPKHVGMGADGPELRGTGVARVLAGEVVAGVSASGIRIGAPAYMSPEQLGRGTVADVRSDVYALACIVYEALLGEVPFAAADVQNLISLRLTQPPPSARAVRDGVPAELDQLLMRCLSRHPSDRCQTIDEVLEVLDRLSR